MSQKAVHIALYPSDWLAGTRGLTPAETGVYITLVCMMYERQEPLPFDHARLARMCNCPAGTFKKILAVLLDEGKIIETPQGLWQTRVEKELAAAKDAIEDASERGRKAVQARWQKAKGRSDECENAKVKPQSDEQQCETHREKKDNKNNDGAIRKNYPSNTNQNQNQIEDSSLRSESSGGGGNACAREPETGLVSQIAEALGFNDPNGTGWPKYWVAADAHVIASRWITDLGLTASEVIHVAVSNAKAHGAPANGPKILTRHMQDFAAAKRAPPLAPSTATQSAVRPAAGHGIKAQIPEEYLK